MEDSPPMAPSVPVPQAQPVPGAPAVTPLAPAPSTAKSSNKAFRALMRKNLIMKTRGDLCCCTGTEIILPAVFFVLMCLPKMFLDPTEYNDATFRLESFNNQMPESTEDIGYKLLYTPDTPDARTVAQDAVKRLICDRTSDAFTGNGSDDGDEYASQMLSPFFAFVTNMVIYKTRCNPWEGAGMDPSCRENYPEVFDLEPVESACGQCAGQTGACSPEVFDQFIMGFADEEAAIDYSHDHRHVAMAVVNFEDIASEDIRYTLRTYGKDFIYSGFEKLTQKFVFHWDATFPSSTWKAYIYWTHVQTAVDKALLTFKHGAPDDLVDVQVGLKRYPWLRYKMNIAGVIAAEFLALLLPLAFISSTIVLVKSIVQEKELRLREGMLMMGLSNRMYWGTWFATHFLMLQVTMVICTLVGIYPFEYTNPGWMYLFLSLWSCSLIAFCYLLSTLFSRSRIASNVSIMLYMATLVPAMVARRNRGGMGWGSSCLCPASALYMWGAVLSKLEVGQMGITADTIDLSVTDEVHFSAGTVITMAVVDTLLYGTLAWYLDNVLPSMYGIRQPPWFLFLPSYWSSAHHPAVEMPKEAPSDAVEPLTPEEEATAAVKVSGLVKEFGAAVRAVDGLSFSFARGHISALLGHNGAGKTTTISMLTGMLTPSGGSALVDGKNIAADMAAIRQSLGVCPQFDILWPVMSVEEHLTMAAGIKGLESPNLRQFLLERAAEVGLGEKFLAQVSTLSGGQKRKLSLALAFLGLPAVVFLDEPSSGMDPYSRQQCWEVIRKFKSSCAIVLTTHFMDEADTLGDRIAIMSAGKLACLGSSPFLKTKFGLGYILTVEKRSSMTASDAVLDFVKTHVPAAKIGTNVGTELTIKLPFEYTGQFADMLEELDGKRERLGLLSYGLSCTTLEEVFLAISKGKDINAAGDLEQRAQPKAAQPELNQELNPSQRTEFLEGAALRWAQFRALMTKRLINMRRDKMAVFTQLVIPTLFTLAALALGKIETQEQTTYRSVPIDADLVDGKPGALAWDAASLAQPSGFVDAYEALRPGVAMVGEKRNPATYFCFCPSADQVDGEEWGTEGSRAASTAQCVEVEAFGKSMTVNKVGEGEGCPLFFPHTLDALLLAQSEERTICVDEAGPCDAVYLHAADVPGKAFAYSVLPHDTALHALPLGVNRAHSAIHRLLAGGRGAIHATNHPMPEPLEKVDEDNAGDLVINLLTAVFTCLGLSCLSASFAVFLVWEKTNNAKHLQMVSGVNKGLFWLAAYLSDLLNYLIPWALLVVICVVFDTPGVSEGDNAGAIALLLLFFGAAAIPFTYLFHYTFKNEMNALAALMGGFTFLSMSTVIAGVVLEGIPDDTSKDIYKVLKWLFRLLPHYCAGRGIYDVMSNHGSEAQLSPEWCQTMEQLHTATGGAMGYICNTADDPLKLSVTGYHLIFLAVEAVAYFLLNLALEYSEGLALCGGSWPPTGPARPPPAVAGPEDEDVAAERERVAGGRADDDIVVAKGLDKSYKHNHAVKNLHFSIAKGQCFGLLGINGAGKTTTFKMITGEFLPSAGDALVRGRPEKDEATPRFSVVHELSAARRVMGYCPQFDGLQANMTGREHLRMYAMFRGVPGAEVRPMVDALIAQMDLAKYADRQAGTYSGGNKRKLSVAIALVGDPPIVLLDEPSTGMDPEARRFMWDVISTTMQNRCVVLTSHSMEECEALCNKLGIMVSGQFRCLGTLQHLKTRFTEGYSLEMRTAVASMEPLISMVMQQLAGCEVVERGASTVKLRVPPSIPLPTVFRTLEGLRTAQAAPDPATGVAAPLFEDYSLAQTSLEQVFLRFASQQQMNDMGAPPPGQPPMPYGSQPGMPVAPPDSQMGMPAAPAAISESATFVTPMLIPPPQQPAAAPVGHGL